VGLLDNLKTQIGNQLGSQFIEIIQWLDDSYDAMVYRFPVYNQEIKMGAQLTVRENQAALFINEGKAADLFGPGRYELTTQNMPILTTLRGWKYGFQSPFKAEVYFFNTRLFTDLKWGTTNPVMMRDAEFGMIRLRAFGTYAMKVSPTRRRSSRRSSGRRVSRRPTRSRDSCARRFSRGCPTRSPSRRSRRSTSPRSTTSSRATANRSSRPSSGLRPRPLEVLHRERLPPRGSRGRDRPAHEAGRPRRQDGAVHAAAGRGRDEDRRREPGRRRGRGRRDRRGHRDGRNDGRRDFERMGPAGGGGPMAPPPPPPAPGFAAPRWSLTVDGKTYGPYSDDAVKGMVASGQVAAGTLAWKPGAAGWAPISTFEEFAAAGGSAQAPPPPPPAR
jgi:hypothetical protein